MGTHARLSHLPHLRHLAKRFFGSLRPGGPPAEDEAWAARWLGDGELLLWRRMSGSDRRHAIGVARRVLGELPAAERAVVAAALLHDVGKVDSGLGTFARVVATVLDRKQGDDRFARYRRHDVIGASLLEAADADPLTVTWAREHHLPPARWTLPIPIATALKAADDD